MTSSEKAVRPLHFVTFTGAVLALYYLVPLVQWLYPPEVKIGLVLIVLINPLVILILTAISGALWRPVWVFPLIAAALFIPSMYVYYNDSALIYVAFYLIVGAVGTGIGAAIRRVRTRSVATTR